VLDQRNMSEQRLIDIETKIAHQEILVSELNQVIAQQQETIDQLQAALKKFFKQFREKNLGGDIGPADQKPPHY
jgi:SlyX protein